MSLAIVSVVSENPNDQVGGGGCLCSDTKRPECHGPYVVWTSASTDSNISPHAVIGRQCLLDALWVADGESLTPTTDRGTPGGSPIVFNRSERQPGRGPRDGTYVPLDGDDAKLLRDGSRGALDPEEPRAEVVEDPPKAEPKAAAVVEEPKADPKPDSKSEGTDPWAL